MKKALIPKQCNANILPGAPNTMTATFSNKKVGYTYCSCLPRVAFMEWSFSSCSRILCVKRFLGSVASIVASFSKIVMPSSPVPTPLWTYVALFFLEVLVTSNKLWCRSSPWVDLKCTLSMDRYSNPKTLTKADTSTRWHFTALLEL